jgi:hypothetical protein
MAEAYKENPEFVTADGGGEPGETSQSATWVHYVRVALDVVLLIMLVVVVAVVAVQDGDASRVMHIHEVPVYLKSNLEIGKAYQEAVALFTEESRQHESLVGKIHDLCGDDLTAHPMCQCISSSMSLVEAKNCMLQKPIPAVYSDWNIATVSSPLFLWFISSTATSVGSMPFISTYISTPWNEHAGTSTTVAVHSAAIVSFYLIMASCTFIVPICYNLFLFGVDADHWGSLANIYTWGVVAMVSLGAYNLQTIRDYVTFFRTDSKKAIDGVHSHHVSVSNWMVYVHLLISAPAIAVILHMAQRWNEYGTLVNTTLLLSIIFAVDAFSAEMANYWAHFLVAGDELGRFDLSQADKEIRDQNRANGDTVSPPCEHVDEWHLKLGLIRLFAWIINAVLMGLLYSLSYPVDLDSSTSDNAIYILILVVYAAVFLLPDLMREFTHLVSFNLIQFRMYGDLLMRTLILMYIWRASSTGRV